MKHQYLVTSSCSVHFRTFRKKTPQFLTPLLPRTSQNTTRQLFCQAFARLCVRERFRRTLAAFNLCEPTNRRWLSTATKGNEILVENYYRNAKNLFGSIEESATNTEDNPGNNDVMITVVRMNRVEKANAMGRNFVDELTHHMQHLDPNCRCVVLTSSSPKVFSAGADLRERATMSIEEAEEFVHRLRCTMESCIAQLSIPTIAAIEGIALGGGLEIALATDIRVVSETATLGLPETSLAIIPGAGGTQRLPRLVGTAKAKELIFTGKKINGKVAGEIGLAQQVTPPGEAEAQAIEMAWQMARNGPVAIRASKEAIQHGMSHSSMTDALEVERKCYAKTLPTGDRLEGLAAFRDGRRPLYSGR